MWEAWVDSCQSWEERRKQTLVWQCTTVPLLL